MLLKPLEYRDPDRLVRLSGGASIAHFEEIKNGKSFSDVGAFAIGMEDLTLSGSAEPEVLKAARVSANFLSILGVEPLLGRSFLPEEDTPAGAPVAMISAGLWRRRLHGDPHANRELHSSAARDANRPHGGFANRVNCTFEMTQGQWPLAR